MKRCKLFFLNEDVIISLFSLRSLSACWSSTVEDVHRSEIMGFMPLGPSVPGRDPGNVAPWPFVFISFAKKKIWGVSFPLKAPSSDCTSFSTPAPGLVACECPCGRSLSWSPSPPPQGAPITQKAYCLLKVLSFSIHSCSPMLFPGRGDPLSHYLSSDILLTVQVRLRCPRPC